MTLKGAKVYKSSMPFRVAVNGKAEALLDLNRPMEALSRRKADDLYEAALVEAKRKRPDNDRVFSLLTESMKNGNPKSMYALATCYLHGKHVKKSLRNAIQLLRQSAKKNVPKALYDLAVCYELGTGVKKNERLALEYYMRAALYGDDQAVYEVGRCYYHGVGVDRNRRIAKVWLDRANDLGVHD